MTRQRRHQIERKSKGLCQVEGCLGFRCPESKTYCLYHLNRHNEKPTKNWKSKKVIERLAEEQRRLDSFILAKAGFSSRHEALKHMAILDHLQERLSQ